jgi:flavin-dependent dehydrogenase
VVGGGPSGACAAEALARNPNIECVLFERKMDNAKPCGGAIPVCMVEEFNLPSSIIDRKVSLNYLLQSEIRNNSKKSKTYLLQKHRSAR